MNLYIFACEYLRNIEIGYANKLWAVSALDDKTSRQRWGKAQLMSRYSRGLIYSSADKTFTMPFVTESKPDDCTIDDIWDQRWEFPFAIHPLGGPDRLISLEVAKHSWPMLSTRINPTHAVNGINGYTVFVANEIEQSQWNQILEDLGDEIDSFPQQEEQRRATHQRTARQQILDRL